MRDPKDSLVYNKQIINHNHDDMYYTIQETNTLIDTHTHVAADITDFNEAVDDRVNELLDVGPGLDKVYDDVAGTYVINLSNGSGGGVTDHGALTGLADDDHTQYHNDTRGDARYYTKSQVDTSLSNKADVNHDHTGVYEPANANIQSHISSTSNPHGTTAAQVGAYTTGQVDSLLSGKSDTTHLHTGVYLGVNDTAVNSDKVDGFHASVTNTNDNVVVRDSTGNINVSSVNLNGNINGADYIDFDLTAITTNAIGRLAWNDTDGTLNLGLKGGNIVLHVGQSQVQMVNNNTGSNLLKGEVVYVSGASGNKMTVTKALATTDPTSSKTFGITAENINHNNSGFVITSGFIRDIDTSTFTEGTALWLSATVTGGLTSTRPTAPNHAVLIGWCVRSHPTVGSIFIHVQNGFELEELHNVLLSTLQDKEVLTYESSTGLWKNKSISTIVDLFDPAIPDPIGSTTANEGHFTNLTAENLTVSGNLTYVDSQDLVVVDPLIYIGEGNASNINDLGFVASFDNGTYQHSGLVRDASDGKWKLFSNVVPEPTNVVDFTNAVYDHLKLGTLEATSITAGGNNVLTTSNIVDNITDGVTDKAPSQNAVFDALALKSDTSHTHPGLYEPADANIQAHISSTSNPHATTAAQVGLGNVENKTFAVGVADATNAATSKTTPVDADVVPLADSASSFSLKKLSWANIKATLKTYFDTLYSAIGHLHTGTYEPANANIQTHVTDTTFHLDATQKTDLTDGGDSTLHFHSADRNRTNHSGTQLASTISDFSEAVDDRVNGLLVAGTNVTLSYDDVANSLTINSTASGGVTDHGLLTGLADDDHTQYLNNTRGDARYYTKTLLDGGQLDNRYFTETEVNNLVAGYLPLTGGSVTGQTNISAATSTHALRITQTGSGNAILIEDSASPDASPVAVNGAGEMVIGSTTATTGILLTLKANDTGKLWTPNGNLDLVIENNTSAGMNIISGISTEGRIYFSDTDAEARGGILYKHATDSLEIVTAGATRMTIDNAGNVYQPFAYTNTTTSAPNLFVDATGKLNRSTVTTATTADLALKQDTLVSSTNIKTINGSSILGSGNLNISAGTPTISYYQTYLAADVQMLVSSQWYNGPSVVLPPGVYLVNATLTQVRTATSAEHVAARLTNLTNTYATTQMYHASTAGTGVSLKLTAIVTLATTTTVYLQGATTAGSANSLMRATNTQVATNATSTVINAIQLA